MRRIIAALFATALIASFAPSTASAHVPGHRHKCWDNRRHTHWHWC